MPKQLRRCADDSVHIQKGFDGVSSNIPTFIHTKKGAVLTLQHLFIVPIVFPFDFSHRSADGHVMYPKVGSDGGHGVLT